MLLLRPALTLLFLGAAIPALVAPGYAQTCACPSPGEPAMSPVIQSEEPPPPLPEYDQPPIPEPGYIWTPGYWAWNTYDYYWVPGVWVPPPQPGLLWTPGYWAFVGAAYLFHPGYWGPHVGFYGGVNYGYGYNGFGYGGGRWEGNRFLYNTTVNNFGGARVTNIYSEPVVVAPGLGRTSFNGGPGGIGLRPTPEQERLTTEEHIRATPLQVNQARAASMDQSQFRTSNQGKPGVAATARPGELKGPGVVPAKGTAAIQPGGPTPPPAPLVAPAGEPKLPQGMKPGPGGPGGPAAPNGKLPANATLPPAGQPGAPGAPGGPMTPTKPNGEKPPGQNFAPEKLTKPTPPPMPKAETTPPNVPPPMPKAERTPPNVPPAGGTMRPPPPAFQKPPGAPPVPQAQMRPAPGQFAPRPGPGGPGGAGPGPRPGGNAPERRGGGECGKPGQPPCR